MARARSGAAIGIVIDTTDLDHRRLCGRGSGCQRETRLGRDAREPNAGTRISARIDARLCAGVYWIRLYSSRGELLREFGLRAE